MFCASGATTMSAPSSSASSEITSCCGTILLHRSLAADSGAVEFTPVALIVVVALVDAKTVVPQRQHVGLPAQTAGECGLGQVLGQEMQDRRRFLRLHALDTNTVGGIYIQRLLAGHRMGTHHRMSIAPDLAQQ